MEHGTAVGREGAAEVEQDDALEPAHVLHVQWLVEAVELPQLLQRLLVQRVEVASLDLGRVAGRQMNDEEGNEGDADQEREREQQAADRVPEQRSARRVPLQ